MWLIYVLYALNRLINALSGGHHKATISGRVGSAVKTKKHSKYWKVLAQIIDHSFLPIDGQDHCKQAMIKDGHYHRGTDPGLGILSIFIVAGCIVIWPTTRIIARFKKC